MHGHMANGIYVLKAYPNGTKCRLGKDLVWMRREDYTYKNVPYQAPLIPKLGNGEILDKNFRVLTMTEGWSCCLFEV